MADETRNIILKIVADNTAAKGNLEDTQRALNANQRALQQLNNEYKKGSIATDEYTQAVDGLTSENKELLTTQNNVNKSQSDQVKSVQDLRNRYKQLRETLNAAKVGVNITTKEFEKLKKETFETQEEIRDFDRSISGSNTLVGEYTRGLIDAGKQQRIFGVSVGSVTDFMGKSTQSIQGSTGALKVFKIALASTGIGLLIVALGSLVAFLTKSQRGIDFVNKTLAIVKQGFAELTDLAINLGESIFNAVTNPKQAIIDLGDTITNNIINRFKAFSVIGDAIVKIFSDITNPEGWEQLANGALQFGTGIEDVIGKTAQAGQELKKFYSDTASDISAAASLEERRQELERRRVDFIVREAQLRAEIADQEKISEDRNNSIAERQAANIRAIELTNELNKEQNALGREELAILKTQNMLSESTLEDVRAEKELEAQIFNIEKERDEKLKSLNSVRAGLVGEIEKENQAIIKQSEIEAKAAQDAANAKKQAQLDLQQFELEQQILNEENEILKAEKEIELEISKRNRLLDNEKLIEEERQLIIAQSEANINSIRNEATEKVQENKTKEVEIERTAASAKVGIAQNVFDIAQNLSTEGSGFARTLALAQAAASTYQGANAAFASAASSPITTFFPAYPAVQAGLAVASGLANVAKIQGVQFAKGGELKEGGMFNGASHANGGIKFRVGGRIHEAEGGEAIINKRSTAMFRSTLSAINVAGGGKKFANGDVINDSIGAASALPNQQLMMENSIRMLPQPVVRVSEINNVQSNNNQIVKVSSL